MDATGTVRHHLQGLQDHLCQELSLLDPKLCARSDLWERPEGGGGCSRAFLGGSVLEKGGINFSDVCGDRLPASATAARPHLAGRPFRAMGVSVVLHPLNPFVPTAHMNTRYFQVGQGDGSTWWFGGGFDLTPTYPFEEDSVSWHAAAAAACAPFGAHLHPQFRENCDRYFWLPHRREHRGVGGLFFDDWNRPDFPAAFALARSIAEAFFPAWSSIVERRRHLPWGERERQFQLLRRGRYVEFNLVHDRGTLFGLQSGGRTESILISMPPLARWEYGWQPDPGSAEESALEFFKPRHLECGKI